MCIYLDMYSGTDFGICQYCCWCHHSGWTPGINHGGIRLLSQKNQTLKKE